MASNNNSKNDERAKTKYQIGISDSNAAALQKQGKASGEKRGKTYSYGAEAYKLPGAQEEDSMTKAGTASTERRQKHVTEDVAKGYRSSR